MALPPYLISANVIVCERTLLENDGVMSAIRIIDIFYVSERPADLPETIMPTIQAYGCASIKTVAGHNEEHTLEVKIINTAGEIATIGEPIKARVASPVDPEILPGGATINVQINLIVKRFGTCYLCLFVDGEELARTPLSVLLKPVEKIG